MREKSIHFVEAADDLGHHAYSWKTQSLVAYWRWIPIVLRIYDYKIEFFHRGAKDVA